jgi:hypothetical protein
MPIRACPQCGSDRLGFPGKGESSYVCWTCKWQGAAPVEFPNFDAWKDFRGTKTLTH